MLHAMSLNLSTLLNYGLYSELATTGLVRYKLTFYTYISPNEIRN